MTDLAGQVAIVTGAGRGIGRSIAQRLAQEGATLVITARTKGQIEEVAQGIVARGGEAWALPADVANPDDVHQVVQGALKRWSRVDILVNNAGVNYIAPVVETSLEDWDRMMAVNLRGPYLFTKAVLPSMLARQRGVIVNIASEAALRGMAMVAGYCATKFGLLGFSEALAKEVNVRGIRVAVICPGPVDTQFDAYTRNVEDRSGMLSPDVVAQVVCDAVKAEKPFRVVEVLKQPPRRWERLWGRRGAVCVVQEIRRP